MWLEEDEFFFLNLLIHEYTSLCLRLRKDIKKLKLFSSCIMINHKKITRGWMVESTYYFNENNDRPCNVLIIEFQLITITYTGHNVRYQRTVQHSLKRYAKVGNFKKRSKHREQVQNETYRDNVALNFVSPCSISRFQPADVKTAKLQLQFLWPR